MEEYEIMEIFSSIPVGELEIANIENIFWNYILKKENANTEYAVVNYDERMCIPNQAQALIEDLKYLNRKIAIIQKGQMVVGVIGYKIIHTE